MARHLKSDQAPARPSLAGRSQTSFVRWTKGSAHPQSHRDHRENLVESFYRNSVRSVPLWQKILVLLPLLLALSACQSVPGKSADIVIPDAHGGGSALAIDQTSKILASGGLDGSLRLWQLKSGAPVANWKGHQSTINGIQFIRDGKRLVTGGYDGVIAEWDLNGFLKREWDTPSPVMHLVADADANIVVSGHADGMVRLYRLSTSELLHEWKVHSSGIAAVALDAQRKRIAASGADGELAYWKIGGEPRYFDESKNSSITLAFSPDGKSVYGAGWFNLYRWDLKSGGLTVLPTEHSGRIAGIFFMPNGKSLATISRQTDSSVLILEAATGKTERRFQKHEMCGSVVTVSPNGRYLASTSDDASVRIWDLHKTAKKAQ